ncbi:dihydropteroate synthase [Oscillatoria sp. FACHB-1407]|uniref:dihydropteroate synthase n=1 Tax=Oscillatoria sp. FACHB-1407 TaxID=2692847 RepID=UPI0018EFEAF6|nr:dihydropteroate synthase [Oscillatoria sp. FACHB-1407]
MESTWRLQGGRSLTWGQQTYVMGVLNVTPDSFSDGGQFNDLTAAIAQAQYLVESGADILDIGGQSTRPQADIISLSEELDRVIPVIEALRAGSSELPPLSVPISVDTTRSDVARAAIAAGADIVNDISGGTYDPDMLPTVAELGVPVILMHLRGTPKTMQQLTNYEDLIGEIKAFLQQQIERSLSLGIAKAHIAIDPGIGFAKTYDQNLEILRRLQEFRTLDCPILVGASRKSFIGHILNQPDPKQRVWGTAAACCAAIANSADIVRVHDVKEMRDVCRVADAIYRGR